MIKDGQYIAAATMKDSQQSEGKELSAYSRELINDTRDLLSSFFPNEKGILDEGKLDDMAINRELVRTCVIAILQGMSPEERKKFKENPGDLKSILRLAAEKVQLSEEEQNSIKGRIDSLTLEDLVAQSSITDKLDLLNVESDVCKMGEVLYASFEENPEVVQAHAYMNLTEK